MGEEGVVGCPAHDDGLCLLLVELNGTLDATDWVPETRHIYESLWTYLCRVDPPLYGTEAESSLLQHGSSILTGEVALGLTVHAVLPPNSESQVTRIVPQDVAVETKLDIDMSR